MPAIKRRAHACGLIFLAFAATAWAQTPQVSTVNVTPGEDKVRVAAVGDVLDMRVAVSDEAGDIVFESGAVAGSTLDWAMLDAQGQRVTAGTYTLTVTYRTSSGKLRRRVEQVLVTEAVGEARPESAAPVPSAPVEGAGTAGKVAKFTSASTVGNSVMTESAGRIGINNPAPTHTLTINGGPAWTTANWVGAVALPNLSAVGWAANSAGQRRGLGHNNFGLFFFRTASNPGTNTSPAFYDLTIGNTGNVGVGTTAPASKLTVNGGIQILGAGNGIRFADGSIQTKATAGTINGTGAANRIAKFTGPNSFGNSSITDVGGKVGINATSPMRTLQIGPGFDAAFTIEESNGSPNAGFIRFGDGTGWRLLFGRSRESSAGALNTGTTGTVMTLQDTGRVGIGTSSPQARLHVSIGSGYDTAIRARAVYGTPLVLQGPGGALTNFIEGFYDANNQRVFHVTKTGTYVAGSDFAEALPASGGKAGYEPGDVLIMSTKAPGAVEKAVRPFDARLVGVYSTRPGVLGAEKGGVTRVDEDDLPVAIVGIVPTKVSAENGAIRVGDLLTTSATPGHAMRCGGKRKCTGAVLGKAVEPLEKGRGLIRVLVMLR